MKSPFSPDRKWLLISADPIFDAQGKLYLICTYYDITERKRAEEALRASEQRLRLATEVAKIGAFDWDIKTGVNVWTPQLEAMYGLAAGEFGRTQPAWEQLVHPDDLPARWLRLRRRWRRASQSSTNGASFGATEAFVGLPGGFKVSRTPPVSLRA